MTPPQPVSELWSEDELRSDEVELLARYQQNALMELLEHMTPAMRGSVLLWSKRLGELGVVPKP